MKTAIIPKGLSLTVMLLAVWLVSACSPSTPAQLLPTVEVSLPTNTATPKPTASAAPSATPVPTHPPATAAPKPSVTPEPETQGDTPANNGAFAWAKGLEIHITKERFYGWKWSPVRDEIAGFQRNQSGEKDVVLLRYSAPDFQPVEIRAAARTTPFPGQATGDFCTNPDILWSVDGLRIFFSGPIVNPSRLPLEACSLWLVEHDSSNPRLYHPEQTLRMLGLDGWIGDHTLVTGGYREGTRLFDLLTGKIVNWAYPVYYGKDVITRDYLVGTSGELSFYQMFALGRRDEPIYMVQTEELDAMRYARTPANDPSCACPGHTLVYDALPDTNIVLAYSFWENIDGRDPKNVKIDPVQKLVRWDIDQNTISPLVPYGFWGKYSPDGRALAYVTSGPAFLDAKNKPLDPLSANLPVEYGLDLSNAYLQLLDFRTGAVFLSVPVVSLRNIDNQDFLHVGANFSPDGRYLAFLTGQEIALDNQGWPKMVQPLSAASAYSSHLYVLDLKTRRVVWDQKDLSPVIQPDYATGLVEGLPTWSPKSARLPESDRFIYLDAQNNPVLVNLKTGTQTPLSANMGGMPVVQWSASGKYVAIRAADSWETAFITIP